jgi:hypothetical protein
MKLVRERSFITRWWKLLSVLLLIVVIVSAPTIMGFYLEFLFKKQFALFSANDPNLKLVNYKRDWFHSTAALTLKDSKNLLKIDVDIEHGPFLFLYHNNITDKPYLGLAKAIYKIVPAAETQQKLSKYFNNQNLLTGDMHLDFNQFLRIEYKSAVMHYYNHNKNFIISWPGLSGIMTVNFANNKIINKAKIGRFSFSNQHSTVTIGDSYVQAVLQRQATNDWLQTFDYSISQIQAETRKNVYLQANNINLNIQSSSNNQVIQYQNLLSLKQLMIEDKKYAPITIKATIKNIPKKLYKQLIRPANNSAQAEHKNLIMQFFSDAIVLVENGANIISDINVITPTGPIKANLSLAERPDAKDKNGIDKLRGTLNVMLSKETLHSILVRALVSKFQKMQQFKQENIPTAYQNSLPGQQADIFINQQQKADYFISDNNSYVLNFTMQGSNVRLNGKTINIDFLLK